jgi:uncharacterized protein YndB with AHSA1/START domain
METMSSAGLKITAVSDREIMMTRVFDAPRALVFEAMTTPALVKRWLTGPAPWIMSVCEMDLKVGGAYRYVWSNPKNGESMGAGGQYEEIVRPERVVSSERFDKAWYAGAARVTQVLSESGGKTTLTMTLRYESKETRDMVLKSPMEKGVGISYDNLSGLLAEIGVKK